VPTETAARTWQGSPLLVATVAFALGGLGNVAFSMHDGSVAGLSAVRFASGWVLATVLLRWLKPTRPALREVRHPRRALLLTGAADAACAIFVIAAATRVSTLTFSLVVALSPALLAAVGRRANFARGSARQAAAALFAVLFATAAVVCNDPAGSTSLLGVGFAVGSLLAGVVGAASGAIAASVRHPLETIRWVCGCGCVGALGLVVGGAPFEVTPSTVAVALFLTVGPGGTAGAMVLWASARTAPYLVSACSAVSLAVAALGGWLVLGERPTLATVVFATLATASVLVLQLAPARGDGADRARQE
jgi:drug/metabolite transporter (DMT)-like permease